MADFDIYRDIAQRTGGDIYIGVVGPVRTGKSTFIKRFMDLNVIPNIESAYAAERAKDELPQSASGREIMTTEPKFVPNEAVRVALSDKISARVRLIDCVGYMVPGASGDTIGDAPRMVNTPWSEKPIPFKEAAEIGTKKVINEHSTIGIVVTTDGTIADIPRESYEEAEERIIYELMELGKPFVLLLNSALPYAPETTALKEELSEKYSVPVITVNAPKLSMEEIHEIMENLLYEFPVTQLSIALPAWAETLDDSHWLKSEIISSAKAVMHNISKLSGLKDVIAEFGENKYIKRTALDNVELGTGEAEAVAELAEELFYSVLSETTGISIENDAELISTIRVLSEAKRCYDRIENALNEAEHKGYGIVPPAFEEIKIEEPAMFKQGARYGMKLRATGDSLHIIKTPVIAELNPIVGSEDQSREYIDAVIKDFKNDPEKLWDLNIFGRTLGTLISEGINSKIYQMPEDTQMKLGNTLQKITNEGRGGMICILL
ncbi:MAG: stage IV sporulation protein A [Firmicutes bacterium]|nr:stage IV sporulation protein A [Bacillota bacterium]